MGGMLYNAAQSSHGWNASKGIDTQNAKGGAKGWDTVLKGGDGRWEAFNKGGDWGSTSGGVWYASNKDGAGRGDGRRDASKKGDGRRWNDTARYGRGGGECKWGKDGGRGGGECKWGRDGARGRNCRGRNGRGGRGSNFNARWGQNYCAKYDAGGSSSCAQGGDSRASINEWESSSGNKNQEWTARSGESGWNATKGTVGWNVSTCVDTWDCTSKGGSSGWDGVNKVGDGRWDAVTKVGDDGWGASNKGGDTAWDVLAKGGSGDGGRDSSDKRDDCMWDAATREGIGEHGGWDASNKAGDGVWDVAAKGVAVKGDDAYIGGNGKPDSKSRGSTGGWGEASQDTDDRQQAAKSNDKTSPKASKPSHGWSGMEEGMEQVIKSGTDGWELGAGFKGVGVIGNDVTAKGWANKTDGWGEVGLAAGTMNTGGRWGEASQINDDWQHATESNDKRNSKAITPTDGWSGVEGGMEQVMKSGTDGWAVGAGFKDSGVMDNGGAAKGWASETDGWVGVEPAAGNMNTGGSGWGA